MAYIFGKNKLLLDKILHLETPKKSTKIRDDKGFPLSTNKRKEGWRQTPG